MTVTKHIKRNLTIHFQSETVRNH